MYVGSFRVLSESLGWTWFSTAHPIRTLGDLLLLQLVPWNPEYSPRGVVNPDAVAGDIAGVNEAIVAVVGRQIRVGHSVNFLATHHPASLGLYARLLRADEAVMQSR